MSDRRKSGAQQELPETSRSQPGAEREHNRNRNDQHQCGAQDGAAPGVIRSNPGGNRKHAAHHRPRQDVNQPSHQCHGRIGARLRGIEEMLDQHDIKVVNYNLTDKENDRLNTFVEPGVEDWLGLCVRLRIVYMRRGSSNDVGDNQRRSHRANYSGNAVSG